MKVSLVVATVGRVNELARLFGSLQGQTFRDFEIIVVDQNPDNRLENLVNEFGSEMAIQWVRSSRGLSRARNVGLKHADGDIIGFPDDDCWYRSDTLQRVVEELERVRECDGVLGALVDDTGKRSMIKGANKPTWIDAKSALWTAVSCTIFVKRDAVMRIGGFDETLGVGAGTPWGAGEETDFVIRLIKAGARIWYNSEIVVVHPPSLETPERTISYGLGGGRVLALHFSPVFFWGYVVPRALAGVLLAFAGQSGDAATRWLSLRARIRGWVITRSERHRSSKSMG